MLPAHHVQLRIGRSDDYMLPAVWLGLYAGMLAKKVLLLDGRKRGVRVGAADHAKLEGINAKLLFKHKASLQRGPRILPLQHLRLFEFGSIEIRPVPSLIIGKLVVGRE